MKRGIDLGGTRIEGVVLDDASREIHRRRAPTQAARGYEHVIAAIAALHGDLQAAQAPRSTNASRRSSSTIASRRRSW